MSSAPVSEDVDGLFGHIDGDENASHFYRYRCVFVHNSSGTSSYREAALRILGTIGDSAFAIGLDPKAASPWDSWFPQAVEVLDDRTSPEGVFFGRELDLGDLGPDMCRAIWLRRAPTGAARMDRQGATLEITGKSTT